MIGGFLRPLFVAVPSFGYTILCAACFSAVQPCIGCAISGGTRYFFCVLAISWLLAAGELQSLCMLCSWLNCASSMAAQCVLDCHTSNLGCNESCAVPFSVVHCSIGCSALGGVGARLSSALSSAAQFGIGCSTLGFTGNHCHVLFCSASRDAIVCSVCCYTSICCDVLFCAIRGGFSCSTVGGALPPAAGCSLSGFASDSTATQCCQLSSVDCRLQYASSVVAQCALGCGESIVGCTDLTASRGASVLCSRLYCASSAWATSSLGFQNWFRALWGVSCVHRLLTDLGVSCVHRLLTDFLLLQIETRGVSCSVVKRKRCVLKHACSLSNKRNQLHEKLCSQLCCEKRGSSTEWTCWTELRAALASHHECFSVQKRRGV